MVIAEVFRSALSPRGLRRTLSWLTAGIFVGTLGAVDTAPAASKDDFMPFVQLAPFVVNGKQLAISIHARTKRDRKYAEDFSEEVAKVVYEAVTPETGRGLVIIGRKGEPHPVQFFRQFLALAKDGKLDPAVAARASELNAALDSWRDLMKGDKDADDPDIDTEKIAAALPLPLENFGAKLYQLAWREEFDSARVEKRLRALTAADLDGNLFAHFDWVFYLPPRGAFEQAIDDIVADALKKEDVGFFTRTLVKGVMLAVKPKIRRAVEGIRRGLLFSTIVEARTPYKSDEVGRMRDAFIESAFSDKHDGLNEHERIVQAVRERIAHLAEKPAKHEEAASATPEPAATDVAEGAESDDTKEGKDAN